MDTERIVGIVPQYEDKIKNLLDKFLQPSFAVKAEEHLNLFLSFLSGKENADFGNALSNLQIITNWIVIATKLWEENGCFPTEPITVFAMKLASFLSKSESHFLTLNACGVYHRLHLLLKFSSTESSVSTRIAYINLLSSLLQHKSGTEWLIATNNWQDVLTFCLHCHNEDEVQGGYKFLYFLLEQSCCYNKSFCKTTIGKIMAAVSEYDYADTNHELMERNLTPSLRLICNVLECCLEKDSFDKHDYTVTKIFLEDCKLEEILTNILEIDNHNEGFLFDLNKLMVLNYVLKLVICGDSEPLQRKQYKVTAEKLSVLISGRVKNGTIFSVLDLCHVIKYYWSMTSKYIPHVFYKVGEHDLVLENQILLFQVLPVVMLSYSVCGLTAEQLDTEEDIFRSHFITKIFKSMCLCTVRLMHSFRDALITDGDNSIFINANKALEYLMDSIKCNNLKTAAMLFQLLVYVIRDVIDAMNNKPGTRSIFANESQYFVNHFHALEALVKEFDITWRESVETINVMGLSMEFMSFPIWPPELVVCVMNLINISIKRFMPSNLALLIDVTSDSTLSDLGPVLSTKLKDDNAGLRISAINILATISNVAHTKFPSFQKMVLDYNWPSLIVSICVSDPENSVRIAAIKCLQEMIKIYDFWKNNLDKEGLPEKMIEITYKEPDILLRTESVTLLCGIYEYRSIPRYMKDNINTTIIHVMAFDNNSAVKIRALHYYEVLINVTLTNQGMIDGTFPPVTFSKEERKIITLTDKEIKNRLVKVLMELNNYECLSVLIKAMEDDTCLEVSKKAVDVTKVLGDLLLLYEVTSECLYQVPALPVDFDSFSLEVGACNEVIKKFNNDFTKCSELKTAMLERFVNFVHEQLYNFMEKKMWTHKIRQFESALNGLFHSPTNSC